MCYVTRAHVPSFVRGGFMFMGCCYRGWTLDDFQLRFVFKTIRGLGLCFTSGFCLKYVRSRGAWEDGQGDLLSRDVRAPEWRARGGERRRYRGPRRLVL